MSMNAKGLELAAREFEKKYIQQVKNIVQATAAIIQAEASARAPVDLGNLKRSIQLEPDEEGLQATVIVSAEYGIWVEMGTGIYSSNGRGRKTPWTYFNERTGQWVTTRGNEPQPFFHPAVERAAKYFEREMNRIG